LLIAALIIRDAPSYASSIGAGGVAYPDFLMLNSEQLQKIAYEVQLKVLGDGAPGALVKSSYFGGPSLDLFESYLLTDDHQIENSILDAFPYLRKFATRSGQLMLHIVNSVCRDSTRFVPTDIVDLFVAILDAPDQVRT